MNSGLFVQSGTMRSGKGKGRVKRQFFPDSDDSSDEDWSMWGASPEKIGKTKGVEQEGKRSRKKSAKVAEAMEDEGSAEEGQAGDVAPAKTGTDTVGREVGRVTHG